MAQSQPTHYDVLIIGSGFGGSVTALRLVEKGYSVGILEAGRRFADQDFAKNSWHLKDFLWAPALGCYGIQRIHLLRNVMILAGAGVGGGSLNYANTLYTPGKEYFQDRQWSHITDWQEELAPYYDQARRMLGVVENPTMTPADKLSQATAEKLGVGDTFRMAPVGVFFGEKVGLQGKPLDTVADPYFGGAGPERTACHECGECMTGCRHGAKNTLLKNYLYLAEQAGAHIHPLTTVTKIQHRDTNESRDPAGSRGTGFRVTTKRTGGQPGFPARRDASEKIFTADKVVLAAGAWGTQNLLHRQKAEGVAITSSYFPAPDTHIEPVRYGKGSNSMGLLQTLMTDGDKLRPRVLEFLRQLLLQPRQIPRLLNLRRWSQRTVINLVMQSRDNSLRTHLRTLGPLRWLTSSQGSGEPNPTWIPEGNNATRIGASLRPGGLAGGTWPEVFDIPLTAHFIGGCPISDSPDTGVVDPYHRVWGIPDLYVVDGSSMAANPGVNPSLSITANAERAAAMWPNKDQDDPRPAQSAGYQRVQPVAPSQPTVPASAPGALRLPIRPV